MDQAKQQVIDAITSHSNVLVTVSTNPSVDELSAALGLTVMLDNLDKRATSVFSGAVPPAISFLEPEKTFEQSADSLRDFIIALDKEKADHLRYKVEGESVKIFITPYKTQLSQTDLEFSQGDYNVELVIALGVTDQAHLDKALEAHGKILHDATVVTVTAGATKSTLGSTDWHDDKASSLSEMVASLGTALKGEQPLLDQQVSTALLTGIVSATDRFSNDHTTSGVMTIAAQLMAAGANQQLIASKLQEAHAIAPSGGSGPSVQSSDSGSELTIQRDEKPASPPADNQQEFEQQLASVTAAPTGTMADIEQQLHDAQAGDPAAAAPAPSADAPADAVAPLVVPPQPLQADVAPVAPPIPGLPTDSKDVGMPGFEPTGAYAPAPTIPPQPLQADAPAEPAGPPQIIQRHDAVTEPPQQDAPPINSIQNGNEEGKTVNPFDGPLPSFEAQTVEPMAPTAPVMNLGTPEGAALLNSPDLPDTPPPQVAPVVPAAEPVAGMPAMPSVPELPPLPPMPADASTLPLPPPPPTPTTDLGALPPMPSGAVSGDIFGDASAPAAPAPELVAAAPEPGQFRIPGQ